MTTGDASTDTRPRRRPLLAAVEQVGRLTPRMIRIVLGGADLDGFAAEFGDTYVKLQLPPPGSPYSAPFDVEDVRSRLPREQWPRTRTLTVRRWDPVGKRLTIDVVDHGDTGLAGPWAASASPGDLVQMVGPGGAYLPDATADWHLMVGDASALPAIAASLERVPASARVVAVVEVEDADDELELESDGDLRVLWVHRAEGGEPAGDDLLLDAVTALAFLPGRVHAFVHGEAGMVRTVRRHLVVDRGVAAGSLSASGYWKRSRDDEGWREDKAEWKRLVEADAAAAR